MWIIVVIHDVAGQLEIARHQQPERVQIASDCSGDYFINKYETITPPHVYFSTKTK